MTLNNRTALTILCNLFFWVSFESFAESKSNSKPQNAQLTPLWQSEAVFKVPESVLFDSERKILYVSNVDGEQPWANDGKGSIGKLGLDGKVIKAEWVKGLNGPKGMAIIGDTLYVTDIDDVVAIDVIKGKVLARYPVPEADKINDLCASENGTIYFTDSGKGVIYKLINGTISKVVDGIKALNGVHHSQGELAYASDGALYLFNERNGASLKLGGGIEGNADGIERVDKNSWLVSTWAGSVHLVTRDKKVHLLLDKRAEKINAADLGYDPENRIVYLAGFWKNFVHAYQLK